MTATHRPTNKTRAEVMALTSFGVQQMEVAVYLGISDRTLRKHYRRELDTAVTKANAQVARSLFKNAVENDNVSAQIFWLKTRAGFREQKEDDAPKQDQAITINLVDAKRENAS